MISEANHPSRIAVVLLQLVPVQPAWTNEGKTLWSCHHIRYLHTLEFYSKTPRVKISYLFTSHDDIHHVCMQWDDRSLLLFSDPYKVLSCSTDKFQESDQPCYQPTASSNGSKIFFLLQRCLGKFQAVRSSVSKSKKPPECTLGH